MKFSNFYIFRFAVIMVVVVAAVLSFLAMQLKPIQDENARKEKMKNILASVKVFPENKDVPMLYDQYIVDEYVINFSGQELEKEEAFNVDLKKEAEKVRKVKAFMESVSDTTTSPFMSWVSSRIDTKEKDQASVMEQVNELREQRKMPVYEAEKGDSTFVIIPLYGKGLWGPIWGYLALQDDMNTVYGAYFDHKGETPGLGAEISEAWFQQLFEGKRLFDNDGTFVSIDIVKGGAKPGDYHAVDGVSGGTITSDGLEAMIKDGMQGYLQFLTGDKN